MDLSKRPAFTITSKVSCCCFFLLYFKINYIIISRLNAGWSYHTEQNTTFANKNSQLSESEIIAIQKVLERSEMLERIEQERVRCVKKTKEIFSSSYTNLYFSFQ
jgi:hypothetical protein